MRASQAVLSLEIKLGDFEIAQGHVWGLVTEQLHDGRKGDAGTKHLCGVGMSKLVGDDAGSDSGRSSDVTQCGAESTNQHITAARPSQ